MSHTIAPVLGKRRSRICGTSDDGIVIDRSPVKDVRVEPGWRASANVKLIVREPLGTNAGTEHFSRTWHTKLSCAQLRHPRGLRWAAGEVLARVS